MKDDPTDLLHTAFDAYLNRLNGGGLEPSENYLPYDFDQIGDPGT